MSERRRVTYKLYPTPSQVAMLEALCKLHRDLYNGALEERISAWRKAQKSISFADQCASLTQVRAAQPEYCAVNAQSLQVTLKRLNKAFKAFFQRVKTGKTPGFPRFKSKDRFPGFGFKTHGDGFKFKPGANWIHGRLRLSGIGEIAARGEARTPGRIVCCDINRDSLGWTLSLVLECQPHRERKGDREAGLDWGVSTYVTLGYSPGEVVAIENPRLFQAQAETLAQLGRDLSAQLRKPGKKTKRLLKAKSALAKRWRKLANRRKNFTHQTSAKVVREHSLIATEKLAVKNMTASAKGTVEEPGKNIAQKAGLNREILDTSPASLIKAILYKAEEAGTAIHICATRKIKPSQRDPLSWKLVGKKTLAKRTHKLADGRTIGRDHAAALVMLRDALKTNGREPAWVGKTETPTVATA